MAEISVPSNNAEGEGRKSWAEGRRFVSIAHGSMGEAETQRLLAVKLERTWTMAKRITYLW